MRFKSATMLAALALLTLVIAHARAQTGQHEQKDEQNDEKIVDDFVTTRGFGIVDVNKPSAKPKPTPRTRRKPSTNSGGVASKKTTPTNGVKQGGSTAGTSETAQEDSVPSSQGADGADTTTGGAQIVNASAMPLSVGYTVYMKDSAGRLMPVPASKSFTAEDRIAIMLETNTDGYLYVFDAENGKDPVLIYPDVKLDGGANSVRAHVRETYPADVNDAFVFDDTPSTEHLYIVVSRTPLRDMPTGAALKKFCSKSPDPCEWRPTAEQWATIAAAALDSNVREAKSRLLAQATVEPVMPEMISRGIRVKTQAPPPAVVRVADTPGAKMLVTKIELLHK